MTSVRDADATCYLERSKVREILIASDIDNESTHAVLQEVDALPIFTAADLHDPTQSPKRIENPSRHKLVDQVEISNAVQWLRKRRGYDYEAGQKYADLLELMRTALAAKFRVEDLYSWRNEPGDVR